MPYGLFPPYEPLESVNGRCRPMRRRCYVSVGAIVTTLAVVSFEASPVGQAPAPSAAQNVQKEKAAPRTSNGRPDLQGVWDFRTATPLARPAEVAGEEVAGEEVAGEEVAGKEVLTDAQAAALVQQIFDKRAKSAERVTVGVDNHIWFDQGDELNDNRQSLIIDPPDGRFPPLTREGQKRLDEQTAARKLPLNGPEDLGLGDRCLLSFNAGPPIIPTIYNNNMQIVQTTDHLVIMTEMNHTTRIIPLHDRPNLPFQDRQWQGDARSRWEGDTLVVETTNFRSEGTFSFQVKPRPDKNLRLIERFTRVDAKTLRYRYTVDDPSVWTTPWTAEMTMTLNDGLIYEFACHEGNYGIPVMLRGARLEEKAAATKGTSENDDQLSE